MKVAKIPINVIATIATDAITEEIAGGIAVPDLRVEAAPVDQEDVEPAVVVIVEEGHAATLLLQEELLVVRAAGDVQGV